MSTILVEIDGTEHQVPEQLALELFNAQAMVSFKDQSAPFDPTIESRWMREDDYLRAIDLLRMARGAMHTSDPDVVSSIDEFLKEHDSLPARPEG